MYKCGTVQEHPPAKKARRNNYFLAWRTGEYVYLCHIIKKLVKAWKSLSGQQLKMRVRLLRNLGHLCHGRSSRDFLSFSWAVYWYPLTRIRLLLFWQVWTCHDFLTIKLKLCWFRLFLSLIFSFLKHSSNFLNFFLQYSILKVFGDCPSSLLVRYSFKQEVDKSYEFKFK